MAAQSIEHGHAGTRTEGHRNPSPKMEEGPKPAGLDPADAAGGSSPAPKRSPHRTAQSLDQLKIQSEVSLRKSQRNLETAANIGGVMLRGTQELSMTWMNLAQSQAGRMAEGFQHLAGCRTPADLIKAQGDLLQSGMDQVLITNHRLAEVTLRTLQEAADKMTARLDP